MRQRSDHYIADRFLYRCIYRRRSCHLPVLRGKRQRRRKNLARTYDTGHCHRRRRHLNHGRNSSGHLSFCGQWAHRRKYSIRQFNICRSILVDILFSVIYNMAAGILNRSRQFQAILSLSDNCSRIQYFPGSSVRSRTENGNRSAQRWQRISANSLHSCLLCSS